MPLMRLPMKVLLGSTLACCFALGCSGGSSGNDVTDVMDVIDATDDDVAADEGGADGDAAADADGDVGTDGDADGGEAGLADDGVADDGGLPSACGLLTNPGAETGDLTGWTSETGDFRAARELAGSTPAPFEGAWQFAAGTTAAARLFQDVDVTDLAADIDAGAMTAHLVGRLRDWAGGDDLAFLGLEARDASGAVLGTRETPGFADAIWTRREAAMALPAGTRTVRAILRGERVAGSDNDAYFDALGLCVDGIPTGSDDDLIVPPYLTWVTGNAVTVAWETATAFAGEVAYGPTPALGAVESATASSTHQRVRLEGLTPGTEVYYRVQGGGSTGRVHSFRTAPAPAVPFTFVVWGDSQDGTGIFGPLVARMQDVAPDLVLAVGDVVSSPEEDLFRRQLLWPVAPLAAETPLAVAPGNHDAGDDALALFDLHVHQPGHCFGFAYGSVYFLLLNTNEPLPGGANQACLDAALAEPGFAAADFRVALFHEPPRVEYWDGGGVTGTEWVRTLLEPQLAAAGVELVLTGHSHLYAYGPPEGTGGVTWVTTGGGGGMIEPTDSLTRDWTEITFVEFRHHFLQVTVDGGSMNVSAVADSGEVLHEFTIVR
jgi:predicted phosphodiesterase